MDNGRLAFWHTAPIWPHVLLWEGAGQATKVAQSYTRPAGCTVSNDRCGILSITSSGGGIDRNIDDNNANVGVFDQYQRNEIITLDLYLDIVKM